MGYNMVAFARQSLIRHLPVAAAVVVGVIAAGSFLLMPTAMLETLVWRSGVVALIPVAQPPLGMTARAVLALSSGAVGAAVVWAALYLLVGPGGLLVGRMRRADGVPMVRRADAHPDAPPRKPMSAADLGLPMMEVGTPAAERDLPRDLDQPLAAFDPLAIRPVPMAPVRPVAPLVAKPAEPVVERIETFALPPVQVERAPTIQSSPPSIEALLRRLEEGAERRTAGV